MNAIVGEHCFFALLILTLLFQLQHETGLALLDVLEHLPFIEVLLEGFLADSDELVYQWPGL